MSNNNSSAVPNFFTTALTLLFIGLKLTDNIDWSWWWVLSPLWISIALWVLFILIVGTVLLVRTHTN